MINSSKGPFDEPRISCETSLLGNRFEDDYCNAIKFGEQVARETLIDITNHFKHKYP